jgi:hypothetical protein
MPAREGRVSAASRIKFYYLAYASRPKAERFLYRVIRKSRVAHIIEFGMTSLPRSRRLIEAAQRFAPGGKVSFAGIDLFESAADVRAAAAGVFRALRPTGASVRLLPGKLSDVLADAANNLTGTDLLLVANTITDDDLAPAWFYLPRMLHAGSLVLREGNVQGEKQSAFERISLSYIQSRAAQRFRPAA